MFASYLSDKLFKDGNYLPYSIISNPKILHFAGFHPWKNLDAFDSIFAYKWTEISFESPFFANKKPYLLQLKLLLFRCRLYYKYSTSKEKKKFYMDKISSLEKRIEYFTKIKN